MDKNTQVGKPNMRMRWVEVTRTRTMEFKWRMLALWQIDPQAFPSHVNMSNNGESENNSCGIGIK